MTLPVLRNAEKVGGAGTLDKRSEKRRSTFFI